MNVYNVAVACCAHAEETSLCDIPHQEAFRSYTVACCQTGSEGNPATWSQISAERLNLIKEEACFQTAIKSARGCIL